MTVLLLKNVNLNLKTSQRMLKKKYISTLINSSVQRARTEFIKSMPIRYLKKVVRICAFSAQFSAMVTASGLVLP